MKGKKIIIILTAIVLIITGIIAGMKYAEYHSEKIMAENLELGERYLTEQDYEAAVVAFSKVIEADPKCVDAYLMVSDAYIGLGDYDSAIEQLELGYAETGDESIHQKLLEIRPEISEEATKLLQGLYKLMEAENYEGAMEYMEEHADTLTDIYYNQMGDSVALFDGNQFRGKIDGTGLVFKAFGDVDTKHIEAFCGEFKDGVPHGKNTKCKVWYIEDSALMRESYFCGKWEKGEPNGEGYYEEIAYFSQAIDKTILEGTFQPEFTGSKTFINSRTDGSYSATYHINVRDGYETTDGAIYDEERGEYHMESENMPGQYYPIFPQEKVWYDIDL